VTSGRDGRAARDLLVLALLAGLLVASRAAMRWHLNLPGHSMLPASALLLLARVAVPGRLAASTTGMLAGVAVALLGMGRGGPLLVLKLWLPGVVVDLGAAALPGGLRFRPVPFALLGGAAGLATFAGTAAVELLAGMEPRLVAVHALAASVAKAAFGAAGGLAACAVATRLRAHGLV